MTDPDQKWEDIPSLDLEMDTDYESRVKEKEGRRHSRVDSGALQKILSLDSTSIPIKIASARQGVFYGVIVDLSQSGIKLTSPKTLLKEEKIKIGFKIGERTVIAKAVIRWTCSNEMYTTAGLEFQDLPTGDAEFLNSLATASMLNKTGAFRV